MPSLKLISATDTQYSAAVLKSLNEQRNNGLFCDVTIIIQDKKFRAHKTVLSASSTYFHQLFSVAGQVIELNFIRPEIFEQILGYIYSSKIIRVRSDMLEELINAGKVLGVKFIANLGSPLSHVKGLPGLSKEPEGKSDTSTEVMPIITESFSISSEEFNQTKKKANNTGDSDSDVEFISCTDAQSRAAKPSEIIDLEKTDSKSAVLDQNIKTNFKTSPQEKKAPPDASKPLSASRLNSKIATRSPLQSPETNSNNSSANILPGNSTTTSVESSSFPSEPHCPPVSFESSDQVGVHKKHVSTSTQHGDFKIKLSDVTEISGLANNVPNENAAAKKTVTLNTATGFDSISPGCKVYANIGEDTYDIVPVKEDPEEGGSKANKGKRSLMATPIKPFDQEPLSPKAGPTKKKSKTEPEDHYELVMDGKTFYVCIVCKRPYVCLTSLRRHFNTHSWEKKYPCRHCDKVFALAEYRTKHEIHHTGERRYLCLLCNKTFLNYQVLSSHCKSVHDQDPSGRKDKDDGSNNLYRLLPCKTVPMKSYSWANHESGDSVLSDDGSIDHMIADDILHSSNQSRVLNWNDLFNEPDASNAEMTPDNHSLSGSNVNSPQEGPPEFEYITPENY